jgi:Fungal N-terminal domain of STAND proteins
MTDPLSIAASVASLLGITVGASAMISKYVASAKGERRDIIAYSNELSMLRGVLQHIQEIFLTCGDSHPLLQQSTSILSRIDECKDVLDDLLQKLSTSSSGNRFKSALQHLVWPLKKEETLRVLGVIHRHREMFHMLLSGEGL